MTSRTERLVLRRVLQVLTVAHLDDLSIVVAGDYARVHYGLMLPPIREITIMVAPIPGNENQDARSPDVRCARALRNHREHFSWSHHDGIIDRQTGTRIVFIQAVLAPRMTPLAELVRIEFLPVIDPVDYLTAFIWHCRTLPPDTQLRCDHQRDAIRFGFGNFAVHVSSPGESHITPLRAHPSSKGHS
ncbi:uncharacterized protein DSM5745_03616 [Aspergillus mulundensis]|uniref:Uncharacterized protein n=1 Tax=Aspergillus mulundensis TaxID=1810919 RepID=A0A3D8SLA5_9EURO|nr:hypothetical protein DSM5745_03616 [Aspergillus mulundensis]RDW86974.1 hypothetical protein DSM5745_03616 [Aspergillus mulundensis]